MSEEVKTNVLSRRKVLAFLGLTTLSLTVPTVLTPSDAEAQQPTPPTAAPPGAQTGTERRQERRIRRTERRQERRTGRVKRRTGRRAARRKGRAERGELRREGGEEKK